MFSVFEVLGGIVLFIVFGGASVLILNKYKKFTPERWFMLSMGMAGVVFSITLLILYLYEYLVGVF